MRLGGVCLLDAIDMAGARPRELLGLSPRILAVDEPADLILFDWEEGESLNVRETLVGSGD
jgi:dihydroorotase-like cyclic amidohydrolase